MNQFEEEIMLPDSPIWSEVFVPTSNDSQTDLPILSSSSSPSDNISSNTIIAPVSQDINSSQDLSSQDLSFQEASPQEDSVAYTKYYCSIFLNQIFPFLN